MLEGLKIKHNFQRVILQGIKKRLDIAKRCWAKQLSHILWAYITTLHSTIRESPFRLAYAMIPIEIGEPFRGCSTMTKRNKENTRSELDLEEERREVACIIEASLKKKRVEAI